MKNFRYLYPFLFKVRKSCILSQLKKYSCYSSQSTCYRKKYASLVTSVHCYTLNYSSDFHISASKCAKQFQETENEYAHQVMANLPNYSNSLLKYPLQVNLMSCHEVNKRAFNDFTNITLKNISKGLTLDQPEFTSMIKNVCGLLPQATNQEIQNMLHCLCLWPPAPHSTTYNFKLLWNTLDLECTNRLKTWSVDYKLLIADYWFYLKLSRISRYNGSLIVDLIQNIELLSNHQIIQLMFLINLQRRIPSSYVISLEKKLHSVIDSVTIEEVGIICLGFFKTESKISNPETIELIIKKFVNNVENVNTVTIASILKFLRKSLNISLIDFYIFVMHKCIPYIKYMDIPTSVHLALLSSECNVYHPLLLNNVSNKLATEITQARLKDCTKLLQCLTHFNHYAEGEFHDLHIKEFFKEDRQGEIAKFCKDIIYAALYYAYIGCFNYNLLGKIFEKKFLEMACLKYADIIHAFSEIDYCIEIECLDYKGPRLDKAKRKVLENRRGNIPDKSNFNMQTRLLNTVYESLIEILGSNKDITIRHILPHLYSPDIIVRLFSKSSKTLSEFCDNVPSDIVLKPPKNGNEIWACFVICNSYSFAYRSKQITGVTAMKLRQLQKIGYNVVFIPFYNLPLQSSHCMNYLKGKLKSLENIAVEKRAS